MHKSLSVNMPNLFSMIFFSFYFSFLYCSFCIMFVCMYVITLNKMFTLWWQHLRKKKKRKSLRTKSADQEVNLHCCQVCECVCESLQSVQSKYIQYFIMFVLWHRFWGVIKKKKKRKRTQFAWRELNPWPGAPQPGFQQPELTALMRWSLLFLVFPPTLTLKDR